MEKDWYQSTAGVYLAGAAAPQASDECRLLFQREGVGCGLIESGASQS